METPYLDEMIKTLQSDYDTDNIWKWDEEKLNEYKAIKEALSMPRVVFSCCPKCESTNGSIIVGTNKIQCADCFDIRAI